VSRISSVLDTVLEKSAMKAPGDAREPVVPPEVLEDITSTTDVPIPTLRS
jgi:hypothetical protein